MPFRRGGFSRRKSSFVITNSIKNSVSLITAAAVGANSIDPIAIATDTGINAGVADVERGSKIFRIWLEILIAASATTTDGVTTLFDAYFMKNPGNNLTPPNPGTQGTSNEKRFIIKTWKGLTGARTEGYPAYHWRGWIKIPKTFQRMATDDRWILVARPQGVAIKTCSQAVYKWFK